MCSALAPHGVQENLPVRTTAQNVASGGTIGYHVTATGQTMDSVSSSSLEIVQSQRNPIAYLLARRCDCKPHCVNRYKS